MKYVFYNTILLLGTIITYWALPGVSNEICVSPTNEYLSCQPENSVLNQFLSARSIHSCGEETQQVSTFGISTIMLYYFKTLITGRSFMLCSLSFQINKLNTKLLCEPPGTKTGSKRYP